jgi:hypothetical protein
MTEVVCVLTGDRLPDTYVQKLHSMLVRTSPKPITLHVLTDRKRNLNPEIVQHDIGEYKLQGWFNKLLLFNPELKLPETFLYLDVTLIVKGDPEGLIEQAERSGKELVLLRDWHYDSYNTCAMRIRRGSLTEGIWNAHAAGEEHKGRLKTDQDYVTAYIRSKGLEDSVGLFPKEMIQSYKRLLKLNRTDPEEARARAENCTILKFHGSPRPHEVLGHSYWIKRALKYPRHARTDHRFLAKEIGVWWR